MKSLKTTIFSFLLVLSFVNFSFAQKLKSISLLKGKNLDQWIMPDDKGCYTLSKKILTVKSEPSKKGSILWTKNQFSDFLLESEFKMIEGTVDSGFFLKSEENQIQIGISGSLKRDMTGSPYIPKKRYPVEAAGVKELLKPTDWNSMKIKLIGNTYTVWLNGTEVLHYTTESIPKTGPIGIQLHLGNEMTIAYKNIKIASL